MGTCKSHSSGKDTQEMETINKADIQDMLEAQTKTTPVKQAAGSDQLLWRCVISLCT